MEKFIKRESKQRPNLKAPKVKAPRVRIMSTLAYEGIYLSSPDLEQIVETTPPYVTLHHDRGTIGIKFADLNDSSVYELSKAYLIPCKDFISKVLGSRFGIDTLRYGIDAIKWEPNEKMIKIHFWRL